MSVARVSNLLLNPDHMSQTACLLTVHKLARIHHVLIKLAACDTMTILG